jgi:calmodulin
MTSPEMMNNNNNILQQPKNNNNINLPNMPMQDADGVWCLQTPEEHAALMEHAADKLVVLKVFAPWCRACKGLEPKFLQLAKETELTLSQQLPNHNSNDSIIQWASLSIQHNKAFVQSLGVLALPTIQFYVGGKLLDTFPCGPSKVPIFKRKLSQLIADHVDVTLGALKPESIEHAMEAAEQAATAVKEAAATAKLEQQQQLLEQTTTATSSETSTTTTAVVMSDADRAMFRKIPYFSTLSLADLDQVLDKAVPLTFAPGSILVREGKPGRTFYVIQSGEVEISQKTSFHHYMTADPMVQSSLPPPPSVTDTSSGYLGTVVNRLGPGDFFGERALITGEPMAASLRVADEPVTLWCIDKDVFPYSCVLSGKSKNTALQQQNLEQVNDKYGVDSLSSLYQQQVLDKQLKESATANQVRGSVNTPEPLLDEELLDVVMANEPLPAIVSSQPPMTVVGPNDAVSMSSVVKNNDDAIFSLLTRFQMIRHVSTCFKYIQETRAVWGDPGSRTRRNMLVKRLSPAQRTEFSDIFALMDVNADGCLELSELQRLLESIGETTDELPNVLKVNNNTTMDGACAEQPSSSPMLDSDSCFGPGVMTYEDYMGIMAEAEFYHLFRDIFASLDANGSGYVKARDLDRVLCGVRDLISDDRKSVIDVDDKDMLIDYEQFSRMLLGTTLI